MKWVKLIWSAISGGSRGEGSATNALQEKVMKAVVMQEYGGPEVRAGRHL
jgi:hypothetical protein